MLAESHDEEQIIARVAALDIAKAELVCCVRVPAPAGGKRRLQDVTTYSDSGTSGSAAAGGAMARAHPATRAATPRRDGVPC